MCGEGSDKKAAQEAKKAKTARAKEAKKAVTARARHDRQNEARRATRTATKDRVSP